MYAIRYWIPSATGTAVPVVVGDTARSDWRLDSPGTLVLPIRAPGTHRPGSDMTVTGAGEGSGFATNTHDTHDARNTCVALLVSLPPGGVVTSHGLTAMSRMCAAVSPGVELALATAEAGAAAAASETLVAGGVRVVDALCEAGSLVLPALASSTRDAGRGSGGGGNGGGGDLQCKTAFCRGAAVALSGLLHVASAAGLASGGGGGGGGDGDVSGAYAAGAVAVFALTPDGKTLECQDHTLRGMPVSSTPEKLEVRHVARLWLWLCVWLCVCVAVWLWLWLWLCVGFGVLCVCGCCGGTQYLLTFATYRWRMVESWGCACRHA